MKRAVVYGAGKIGRGFIGKIFADSGYEVCFLDILRPLVDVINARGAYTVRFVSGDDARDERVEGVRALHSLTESAVQAIAGCDLMATAVGVNSLPDIAPVIARGAVERMRRGGGPLDILLCENQLEVDVLMRGWVNGCLTERQRAWADANLGLVEPTIGRMVPPQPPELLREDPLLIRTEAYAELPVDRLGFKGPIPDLVGLLPVSPFDYYIRRKLFLSNGAHAACAYLGYGSGYVYIWQAMADPKIHAAAREYMSACAQALVAAYGEEYRADAEANVPDLLSRFGNKGLMDTVARVGADPVRKLRRNDRIVGAALFALEHGIDAAPIVRGIVAALRYDRPGDASAVRLQADLRERGVDWVLGRYLGLDPQEPLYAMVRAGYGG